MNLKIISPTVHGLLDYTAATGLIVFPFLLRLGDTSPLALWLSVIGGLGLVAYSLLTDYAFGPLKLLPYRVHLALDLAAAAAFVAAPFAFSWDGITAIYYFAMGSGVVVVVSLSQKEEMASVPDAS
ncbi:MAG: hypothetical protein R3192_17615 [Woeseiaceae bacterium]|nr:hypothetical protein [Woeseiaceae bacterium]